VAASRGNVSLAGMCVVVVLAAIVGDSVGYEVGSRYGTRLLGLSVLRHRAARIDAARARLAGRVARPCSVAGSSRSSVR